jgi:hypothetical protein
MNVAVPLTCKTCGEQMSLEDEKCPFGHVNPDYVRSLLRRVEGTPTAGVSFEAILRNLATELASARSSNCKVIVNVGLSEAGKSWLIARMGVTRAGTHRATLYSEKQSPQEPVLQTGARLPRTSRDEIYVWHLEPAAQGERRATRSGAWRIIDIAGELVSDLDFVNNIVSGRPLYDLLTMTLAHACAVVLTIDGEALAREDAAPATAGTATLDEQNERILNQLVRLLRFLHHPAAAGAPPADLAGLEELKARIRDNPRLDVGTVSAMLPVPVLLMVSKADALPDLAPGADPLRYARTRLPLTHTRAVQNIHVARWAAAAPFVGQSRAQEQGGAPADGVPAREKLDFRRDSYGVRQALEWLDAELTGKRLDTGLTAHRALSRLARWSPFTGSPAR